MTTRETILKRALELFNQRSIEHVGIRELAADLNIRPGNITYYFPKKEDILVELGKQLSELNSATIVKLENPSLSDFMERYRQVFNNHYEYRCLFLSFVSQMQQNPKLSENYSKVEKSRLDDFRKIINKLIDAGYLDRSVTPDDVEHLVSFLSLVARFWISESTVSYKKLTKNQAIRHYLSLIGFVFFKHATAKGKKQISTFLESL
ncbi:MAG: TetR/AcrR family transcriptional regulator [Bacteroidia bacterium]